MNEIKLQVLKLLLSDDSGSSLSECTSECTSECDMGKHIVVLQRGHVVIGDLSKKGAYYHLKNGSIIRSWGTTDGLGQIALEGVQSNTTLDKISDSFFHELTTILIMKCEK